MQSEAFEKLVQQALLNLPQYIRSKIDNVAVCVEDKPSISQLTKIGARISTHLLGLYEGVPKTALGRNRASVRLPDKITIFRGAIERLAKSEEDKKELIKTVVWHEVAHHFGFPEKEVRDLEKKWRNR